MVNDRLSNLLSFKDKFVEHIHPYQEALKTAGYKEKLEYIENKTTNKKKRVRSRQVIWFNPPYSQSVKTNIGAQFLGLISKHFEKTELRKYFNRSTIKLSYSCMPNMESVIAGHNKRLLKKSETNQEQDSGARDCNCRGGVNSCPMAGSCLNKSLIYKAEVVSDNQISTYIQHI
jgi:23S rRNA G2445 N2-methylase RlmL